MRKCRVSARQCSCSSAASVSEDSVQTLAQLGGCFTKVSGVVSTSVRGAFRALTSVVVLAATRPAGPEGPSRALQTPAGAIWYLWSFSRLWVAVI